ncbi:excinuclease ABC subunit UvrA [Brevibacillus humidisoli]|uniref:ATP-binding cassette domain-containing protein n=1 Tax=Brevibacillus humidisoli TaxID=2895522 RepID=UPI001E4AB322|nr:excinuclease ABC subunit UvrA [Brevibacillus humidisoli]UFJ40849.1 excinuclease ABC subunit UvrA [Brevibacillus humidisoli]
MRQDDFIRVIGAREKNLKGLHLTIPKKQITVFAGVSGSGKSALVFDTIAAESQRQLNETYSSFIRNRLPHYGQPEVDAIEKLPVAIVINQKRIGGNRRSTVGTVTDIYALLRRLFSRFGTPFVGYSDVFSFNNPQGMCPECEGLGTAKTIHVDRLIDKEKSLNEGAILFPTFRPGEVRWKRYVCTGLFDNDKKLRDYTEDEWDTLLYKTGFKPPNPTKDWPPTSLYEGVVPRIKRTFLDKDSRDSVRYKEAIDFVVTEAACSLCGGGRLNQTVLACTINGKNIAECGRMQISDLIQFIQTIREPAAYIITEAITKRLTHLISIGLGYVSLNRETTSLSGGESQRIKMVRQLGNSLTDLLYIFDEPSIGLHPHDVSRINRLLQELRDKGNTVLIVDHDPDVIQIADRIVEMGPQAGTMGGEIVYEGDFQGLLSANTLTSRCLKRKPRFKEALRKADGWLTIKQASMHNLQDISVRIPKGVMTAVTGVAGSGKSTLVHHVLPTYFPEAIFIDQEAIRASNRSNIATYTGIFDEIRGLFAKENHVNASLFSFNSQGACPTCKGLGMIYTEFAFMDTVATVCEGCQGNRFTENVLSYRIRGKNISEILAMTVDEALGFFQEEEMKLVLNRLKDVGIHYLSLGQPLSTLSGGELQRVKLATELGASGNLYVLDEPTTGLHLADVEQLVRILDRLVDQGSTLIVIEHNLDVICQADWIIDLGPGAGQDGGRVMFEGIPKDIIHCEASITGKYLKEAVSS